MAGDANGNLGGTAMAVLVGAALVLGAFFINSLSYGDRTLIFAFGGALVILGLVFSDA